MTTSIAKSDNRIKFDQDGWPLSPATGHRFTRDEIVADPTIPYPLHVDQAHPGPYWRRRTPAQLADEQQRITKKAKKSRRQSRPRSRRRTLASSVILAPLSSVERQAEQRGRAMADLVGRVNRRQEVAS